MEIIVTNLHTATEPSDSHTPDLHTGRGARLAADRLPHRQRQRSSQGEQDTRELRAEIIDIIGILVLEFASHTLFIKLHREHPLSTKSLHLK